MAISGLGSSEAAGLAADSRSLDDLRRTARENPQAAVRAAAQQFEAMFLNMVLKSMREAGPKSELFDSPSMDLAQGLLDQEVAAKLAARGTGLSDMIARQLSGELPPTRPAQFAPLAPRLPRLGQAEAGASLAAPSQALAAARAYGGEDLRSAQRDFLRRLEPEARAAEATSGIPAQFILAQAALESGWGRKEIRDPSTGATSHNLFGIKAGAGWNGKSVEVATTEFIDGVAQKRIERFRAYDSYAEAFGDYARMISSHPRYSQLRNSAQGAEGFAYGIARAGYATDPEYGAKLAAVIRTTQALGSGG